MSVQNDREAYYLAKIYGFCPPHIIGTAHEPEDCYGKYEPDHYPEAETRFMVLAHWADGTNILIKYKPAELIPP